MNKTEHQILAIANKRGTIVAADLISSEIPREYLPRMAKKGLLQRLNRGVYCLPNADISEHHDLVLVSTKVPNDVITLLSALAFHQIGTQTHMKSGWQ